MDEAGRHCARMVREGDDARFLAALLAPAERRPALHALGALHLELARVRDAVSEPALGDIRLAWWQETIAGLYEGARRAHPVAEALAPLIAEAAPPRALFETLIDAHGADLEAEPFSSEEQLAVHAARAFGPLFALAGHALGAPDDTRLSAIGAAHGAAALVLAAGYRRATGQSIAPSPMLADAGFTLESFFAAEAGDPRFEPLTRALLLFADRAIENVRSDARGMNRAARPAAAPLAAAVCDLALLEGDPVRLWQAPVAASRMARQWRMLRYAFFGGI